MRDQQLCLPEQLTRVCVWYPRFTHLYRSCQADPMGKAVNNVAISEQNEMLTCARCIMPAINCYFCIHSVSKRY